jgi:hypothetical protein
MSWIEHLDNADWGDWGKLVMNLPPTDEVKMLQATCALDGLRRFLSIAVEVLKPVDTMPALWQRNYCGRCGRKL